MALTGPADGPPSVAPARLASVMDALAASIAVDTEDQVVVDGPALLGERAAHAGLGRGGAVSCGGGCRLLVASDGWMAVSMARPDDVRSVDAWLESSLALEPDAVDWEALGAALAVRRRADLVERARMLGMPVAAVGESSGLGPLVVADDVHAVPTRPIDGLTVVDLSSLWAGPLCADLLGLAGARVIKVESMRRPDGARSGPAAFFDLLHHGHESVALDLGAESGRAWLRRLVARADVVIEASRPRALESMGASFAAARERGWSGVWLTITAHDDTERVGFGDDAAAAGGLLAAGDAGPMFCADAVADPLTGTVAAAVALRASRAGVGGRLSVALARSAALAASGCAVHVEGLVAEPPRSRAVHGPARALGADTDAVLGAL